MISAIVWFAATLMASGPADNWISLQPGDRRVYEHESRDQDSSAPQGVLVTRWRTDETVQARVETPAGTLVVSNVVAEGTPLFPFESETAVLIREACLYELHRGEWTPGTREFAPEWITELNAGHIAPDFCFPLTPGKTWGAPHCGDWRPPSQAKDWLVQSVASGEFRIVSTSSYPGSGETVEIRFRRREGVVLKKSVHHGTIGIRSRRLVSFQSAAIR